MRYRIVFLVDVNQSIPDEFVTDSAKYMSRVITLPAFRILTALDDKAKGETHISSKRNNKAQHIQWGFKFYNSKSYKFMRQTNIFKEFKSRYYEDFENEVERRIEGVLQDSNEQSLDQNLKQYHSQKLGKVLSDLLFDFHWEEPDLASPVKGRKRKSKCEKSHKPSGNFIFLFTLCPKTQPDLRKFAGKVVLDEEILLDSFMPPDLYDQFINGMRLSLYWVDTDLSYDKVNFESVQLVERTLDRLLGSLIPVNTLTQTDHQSSSHFFTRLAVTKTILSECREKCKQNDRYLNGVISYSSVIDFHLQKCKLSPVCEETDCKLTAMNGGTVLCCFSVVPVRKPRNLTHNAALKSGLVYSNMTPTDTLLSTPNENITLRLYGVVQWDVIEVVHLKEEAEYFCTEKLGEQAASFPAVLKKLISLKQMLVLKMDITPTLLLLRPLTTSSATLTILCMGKSLHVEKTMRCNNEMDGDVQKDSNQLWRQLISRAVSHQKTNKSHLNISGKACFGPEVLCRTHLPGCRQALTSLIEKLNERIQQLDFLNEEEIENLKNLQMAYRLENLPIQPRISNQPYHLDLTQNIDPIGDERKSSGNLSSRGDLMLARSQQSSSSKEDKSGNASVLLTSTTQQKAEVDILQTDFKSEEELSNYLKQMYADILMTENNLFMQVQSLVMVPLHYMKEQNKTNPQESCEELLSRCVILPISALREKYQKTDTEEVKHNKIKEFQLQILLRFEGLSTLQQGDQSITEDDAKLQQIITLLRTLSFTTEPKTLSDFMKNTLVDNYMDTMPQTLGNIYDELMQPLPTELESILSPDKSSELSVFSKSLLSTDNVRKDEPIPSSQPSVTNLKPSKKSRKLMHYPSLADIGQKRQIVIDTKITKKENSSSRKKSRARKDLERVYKSSKTKLERRQSVAVMESVRRSPRRGKPHSFILKSPKGIMSPPFKSPARKKFVADTPSHKQKSHPVWKRLEKERRRSESVTAVKVIEESPMKSGGPAASSPSQKKRALHLVRRSFYSAGPLSRSRSMTQANTELADRIAGRVRHTSGKLNSILKKTPSKSQIFKSPDQNSSFLLSQLMGSPTPKKEDVLTPGKKSVKTPAKFIAESPCMNTRSKSPCVSKGFPKALFQESPNTEKHKSKIVRQSPRVLDVKFRDTGIKAVQEQNTPTKLPSASDMMSPSQNTRSKKFATPTRHSVRAILFCKSPESKPPLNISKTPSKTETALEQSPRLTRSQTPLKLQKENCKHKTPTKSPGRKNLTWLSPNEHQVKLFQKTSNSNSEESPTHKFIFRSPKLSVDKDDSANKTVQENKNSPKICKTPSPDKKKVVRTPSSLNHWQRKKRIREEHFQSPKGSQTTSVEVINKAKNYYENIKNDMEVDNDENTLSHGEKSGLSSKKRSLEFCIEDVSSTFSPSKRRRTSVLDSANANILRTSYCLHSRIVSQRLSTADSTRSGLSEGFDPTYLDSQSSSVGLNSQSSVHSQASALSIDNFSASNDEVFFSQNEATDDLETPSVNVKDSERTCGSPVFGSGKKIKVTEKRAIESPGVSDQDKKISPSGRKYSPNVTAKSLMHLMNSPLINTVSLDNRNISPTIHRNVYQRPRSRRSLNLQK